MPRVVGDDPFARDSQGKGLVKIATAFPRDGVVVTTQPPIHAMQRIMYIDLVNQERQAAGKPPLTEAEESEKLCLAVDLIIDSGTVLIRPDPCEMALAFEADEFLQQFIPKKRVQFLHVPDRQVRDAIKRRGERWRMSPLPHRPEEMKQMIDAARTALGGSVVYYYNKNSGTRFLTGGEFARLSKLDDVALRAAMIEIRDFSNSKNCRFCPEIAFFKLEGDADLARAFAGNDFANLSPEAVRHSYQALRAHFTAGLEPEFRQDDLENAAWRGPMYAALMNQSDSSFSEEALLGLSAEFFMQIKWLPGGRIEDGELILDSVFEEESADCNCAPENRCCDSKTRAFIFNFIRDYGTLEYVNIGRVVGSLSIASPFMGRRGVYLAEVKARGMDKPILRILRTQKWGTWDHLDEGDSFLDAVIKAEDYTDYVLNRRLGCWQIGMNVSPLLHSRKLAEPYYGLNRQHHGKWIWSAYFERDYISGIATDKLHAQRLTDDNFSLALARLLGRAAAPNLIVGRCDTTGKVIFDNGDELVLFDAQGLPSSIVLADHTGTFQYYKGDLEPMARFYSDRVNVRLAVVPERDAFLETFIDAFMLRFHQIQDEYRKRRRAFDSLFQHDRRDEGGSFAFRWELVLRRLDKANPEKLAAIIREGCEKYLAHQAQLAEGV